MKKIILWAVIVLLIAGGGTLYFLYRIGDKIVDEALSDEFLEAIIESYPESDNIHNQDNNSATVETSTPETEPEADKVDLEGSKPATNANSSTSKNPNEPEAQPVVEKIPQKPSSTKQPPSSKPTPTPTQKPVIDKKKLEGIKDRITPQDKIFIASDVIKKFSSQEIADAQKMAVDGLNSKEKSKLKNMVVQKFTPEEIEKIKQMYIKYLN